MLLEPEAHLMQNWMRLSGWDKKTCKKLKTGAHGNEWGTYRVHRWAGLSRGWWQPLTNDPSQQWMTRNKITILSSLPVPVLVPSPPQPLRVSLQGQAEMTSSSSCATALAPASALGTCFWNCSSSLLRLSRLSVPEEDEAKVRQSNNKNYFSGSWGH